MSARDLELVLVRHGETTASVGRRVAGWSNPPLTPRGEAQARAVGRLLRGERFDGVWTSDLRRSMDSARLAHLEAADGWPEPVVAEALREVNFGPHEGRSYDDFDGEFADLMLRFRDFEVPGGDTWAAFRDRVHGFIDGLPDGRHLLVVHGGVVRVLTQDVGLDRFVETGTVVGLDPVTPRLLFVREPSE
jgi:broad specificity phosphatase PhoE